MTYDRKKNHESATLRAEKDRSKSEQTFDARITSAFTTVRDDSERIARETNAYADTMLGLLGQLEESHHCRQAEFHMIQEHSKMNKEKFDDLLSAYSSLLNELSPWCKQVVQVGHETTQTQSAQMQKSRKDIMNGAKRRLDEGREKQQLATDASELMKHYKALIMTT